MDDITVEIGGRPAYLYYVSPTQINVLAPMDETDETVTRAGHHAAGLEQRHVAEEPASLPGFFMLDPEGRKYVIGLRYPDNALVGKASLYPGTTVPAKPGDLITLFGTGFGQTNPAIVNGNLPVAAPLVNQVRITMGGRTADGAVCGIGRRGPVPVQRADPGGYSGRRSAHRGGDRRGAEPRRGVHHVQR